MVKPVVTDEHQWIMWRGQPEDPAVNNNWSDPSIIQTTAWYTNLWIEVYSYITCIGNTSPATIPANERAGLRITYSATYDFSNHTYITVKNAWKDYRPVERWFADTDEWWVILVLFDNVGNWISWNIYWKDKSLWTTPQSHQWYSSTNTIVIDRRKTPDAESTNPIDWTNIAWIEYGFTAKANYNWNTQWIGKLSLYNPTKWTAWDVNNPLNLQSYVDYVKTQDTYLWMTFAWHMTKPNLLFDAWLNIYYNSLTSMQVWDGTTPTYFVEDKAQIVFYPILESDENSETKVHLDPTNDRWYKDLISSTCVRQINEVTWTTWSSRENWYELSWNTTDTNSYLTYCQWNNMSKVIFDTNIPITDAIIINPWYVSATSTTTLSCRLTSSKVEWIILDELVSYDNLTVECDSDNIRDFTVDVSWPWTIELPNVTWDNIKIHNKSASDVTVILPPWTTYTWTTEWWELTIESAVIQNLAQTQWLVAWSRVQVYNVTTDTEIFNDIVASWEWSLSYGEGNEFTAWDTVRVRVAYANWSSYKEPLQVTAIAWSNWFTVLIEQVDWTPVNSLNIDGSTVTEYSTDFVNIQVDINDADNKTTKTRLVAWYAYELWYRDLSIANFFGWLLVEDKANFKIMTSIVNLKLENKKPQPLKFTDTDTRLYTDDGSNVIADDSNSIHLDSWKVYVKEIEVDSWSWLTQEQAENLTNINTKVNSLDTDVRTKLNNVDQWVAKASNLIKYTKSNDI